MKLQVEQCLRAVLALVVDVGRANLTSRPSEAMEQRGGNSPNLSNFLGYPRQKVPYSEGYL